MDSGTLISSTLRCSPTVGGSCGRGNECDVQLAILSRNICEGGQEPEGQPGR